MINPYESIVVDFPQSLQVCDPPPTSAVNVTLPAAVSAGASYRSISPARGALDAAANPPQAAAAVD